MGLRPLQLFRFGMATLLLGRVRGANAGTASSGDKTS
jgi:hypothetical protein